MRKHPNIVEVKDAGKLDDGQLYIAMEYLQKGSIEDFAKGELLPTIFALKVMCDVCRGIEYAHALPGLLAQKILKPANILLADDLSGKVSRHFGLATQADSKGASF